MYNKLLKLVISLFCIVWCGMSITSAVSLELNLGELKIALSDALFQRNILPIHFADNWNDFGWFFYFTNGSSSSGDFTVSIWNTKETQEIYECKGKITWFYYNAERWERLWPLDRGTFSGLNLWLQVDWWLYTRCSRLWYNQALDNCINKPRSNEDYDTCKKRVNEELGADPYWYFGEIRHVYSWESFGLVSGVHYKVWWGNFLTINQNSWFTSTFVRYGNKYPFWLIYDYDWWVWLVGFQIKDPDEDNVRDIIDELNDTDDQNIADLFWYMDDGETICYIWEALKDKDVICFDPIRDTVVWLVIEWIIWMGETSDLEIIWNQSDKKMQYVTSATVSQQVLINHVRKNAEILCRWKWNNYKNWDKVICLIPPRRWVIYDVEDRDPNITWVVKNAGVRIKPHSSSSTTDYYDIFIDNWNLIINEDEAVKFVFKTNWFISDTSIDDFTGEVWSAGAEYSWDNAAVWSFIRWNFIINWNVVADGEWDEAVLNNKYFIYGKLSTKDSFDTLLKVFAWQCLGWVASDGTVCPPSWGSWTNPYENAPLVIIDQDYESRLFNS